MKKRNSTIIYRSFYDAIKELPKENQADLWSAIFEFTLNFNEVKLEGINKTIFTLITPTIKTLNSNFENGSQAKRKRNRSETEAKPKPNGSETEAKPKPNGSETEAKPKPNGSETEAYKDKDKDKDKDLDKEKEKNKKLLPIKKNRLPKQLDSFEDLKRKEIHQKLKTIFLNKYYLKFDTEFYWTAKEAKNLNELMKKIEFKVRQKYPELKDTKEKIIESFELILTSISDQWIISNFSISIINAKFNEIFSQIKNNGKHGTNGDTRSISQQFKDSFGHLYPEGFTPLDILK